MFLPRNVGTRLLSVGTPGCLKDRKFYLFVFIRSARNSVRHNIVPNTQGISGFSVQRYNSEEAAQAAYDEALNQGAVTQVSMAITRSVLGPASSI